MDRPSPDQCSCLKGRARRSSDVFQQVAWGDINFYEHKVILGDNPGGSLGGVPWTIGWRTLSMSVVPLDEYETARERHKSRAQMRVSPMDRTEVLIRNGFRMEAILKASMKAEEVRMQRAESSVGGRFENFRNVFQRVFAGKKEHQSNSRLAAGLDGALNNTKKRGAARIVAAQSG